MSSIFSKIVNGDIPCHKIWEDEEHLAFLDIQPLSKGHALVIPKKEEDDLFDLSPQRAEALWSAAHKVARLLKLRISCQRVAVLVLGYEVPHAHIHLIPTQSETEIFKPKRQAVDHSALSVLAAHIRDDDSLQDTLNPTQEPTTADIENRWDDFADRFVSQVERTSLRVARVAIDHLQLETAKSILEIGCGGGGAGLDIQRRLDISSSKAHLTLTDLSKEMVKIATQSFATRTSTTSVEICRADAQSLPFEDHSFDRLLSCLNLMLVPDPQSVLREAARVLTPQGISVWVVWGRPEHSHMMTITGQALNSIGLSTPPPARSNFHLGGRDTLKEMLEANGFHRIRRWYQAMNTDITTGEDYVQMTTALRPELIELINDEEQYQKFISALRNIAQCVLDRGEAIGLDALIVVAQRK